jgi:predicted O-linked N-acetylglucosamine transferase (SPINDLY family)
MLARMGHDVVVFSIDGSRHNDVVSRHIIGSAGATYFLYPDMTAIIHAVQSFTLDVLIYPEIGLDPITYFLSFTRLAKLQVVLMGHPETTGVPNLDVFITSTVDESASAKQFSEKVWPMRGLGVPLTDVHGAFTSALRQQMSPEFRDEVLGLNLPRNAHVV